MKKLWTLLLAAALTYACGSDEGGANNNTQNTQDSGSANNANGGGQGSGDAGAGTGGAMVANERGLELIGASDCTACHAIDRKVIGPAYTEVAKRYENNDAVIDSLVGKIKKGGMGNWGNVPMTPHPDLPDADAREMVKYILSLKNQQ